MNEGSPVLAASRTEVQDPVRAFQDVEVVLDDYDGVPLLEQSVERLEEFGDVVHVKPGGGLVKNHDWGAMDDGAGDGYALFLSCGKLVYGLLSNI